MVMAFHVAAGTCCVLMVLLGFALKRMSHWKFHHKLVTWDYESAERSKDDAWNHVERLQGELGIATRDLEAHKTTCANLGSIVRDKDAKIAKLQKIIDEKVWVIREIGEHLDKATKVIISPGGIAATPIHGDIDWSRVMSNCRTAIPVAD